MKLRSTIAQHIHSRNTVSTLLYIVTYKIQQKLQLKQSVNLKLSIYFDV